MARFGRPVAARAMGLESGVDPMGWIEKAKLAEVPGRIVWVVLPVAATAKSAFVVPPPAIPTPMIAGVDVLGAKLPSPA